MPLGVPRGDGRRLELGRRASIWVERTLLPAVELSAFLPEHPEAWTGYGENGFIGGFRDAACADLCVRLARLVAKNGDAQAAARFARLAPLLKP